VAQITELTTARTLALSDIGAYIKTGNAAATPLQFHRTALFLGRKVQKSLSFNQIQAP
jgi:hypothetical protein